MAFVKIECHINGVIKDPPNLEEYIINTDSIEHIHLRGDYSVIRTISGNNFVLSKTSHWFVLNVLEEIVNMRNLSL